MKRSTMTIKKHGGSKHVKSSRYLRSALLAYQCFSSYIDSELILGIMEANAASAFGVLFLP
jgi:hypothetical protein